MDCTSSCRLQSHANDNLSAITREDLPTLKAVLKRICSNPSNLQLTDDLGRHAIHVAASCGKAEILEWLIEECKVNLEVRDLENGWTALHRSLFYGQLNCAELLLNHGADLYALDKEYLTPLDLILLDSPFKLSTSVEAKVVASYDTELDDELCLGINDIVTNIHMSGPSYWTGNLANKRGFFPKSCIELIRQDYRSDLYTWGSNTNFTLGHEDESLRQNPEMVEALTNDKTISIVEVVMCKFHSLFLTHDGRVFTCGHGRGGRLGHGNEQTQLAPKKIDILKDHNCVAIAASQNHTIIVTDSGLVFTFGLNDMHQLGHSPAPLQCLVPRMIQTKSWRGKHIIGASSGQYHSVMFTNNELYTCGLNIGQLGHLRHEKFITTPRLVTSLNYKDITIVMVSCADSATVCATSKGDIFVLSQYACKKVIKRFSELKKLVVSGGDVELNMNHDVIKHNEKATLTLLNGKGSVFQWKDNFGSLRKCKWMSKKEIEVADVSVGKQLYVITGVGELYSCTKAGGDAPMDKPLKSSSNSPNHERDWNQKDIVIHYDVKRCPMVHRGIRIFTDRKSKGFAVLLVDPSFGIGSHPEISPSTMCSDFKQLLKETIVEDDIHDVNLMIKGHVIPVHKYILASKSPKFHHILIDNSDLSNVEDEIASTVKLDVDYEDVKKYLEDLYSGHKIDDSVIFGTKKSPKPKVSSINHRNHAPNRASQDDECKDGLELLLRLQSVSLQDLDDFSGPSNEDSSNVVDGLVLSSVQKNDKKTENKDVEKQQKSNKKDMRNETKSIFKGLKFKRSNCPELYDVTIESEDGVQFLCHKCILIARLDYFRSMLACGWLEASEEMRVLNMPIHSSVLQVVLDYLYTDQAKIIRNSQDIEFIGNVLVIADQLLIGRLREICEMAMTKLISLRNAMELLEFSCVYNANQLKDSCLEFICINLGNLIEAGYLSLLNKDTLDLLSKAYKEAIPQMSSRIITPQFDHIYALAPEQSSSPSKRRRSSGRKRSIKSESEPEADPNTTLKDNDKSERKLSISVNDVFDEVIENKESKEEKDKCDNGIEDDDRKKQEMLEPQEEIDDLLTENQNQDTGQWYRKKSDTKENQWLKKTAPSPKPPTNYKEQKSSVNEKAKEVPKSKPQGQLSPRCPWNSMATATSQPSNGLREIMAQQLLTSPTTKSAKSPNVLRGETKGKQSQKQRKKAMMAQEKENALASSEKGVKEEKPIKNTNPPVNPWGLDKKPNPVRSLRELIDLEEKSQRTLSNSPANISPSKRNERINERSKEKATTKTTRISWGLRQMEDNGVEEDVEPPVSPKNAWQAVGSSFSPNSVSFADILHLQERENTNLKRKKPLKLIQLEDRAIQELLDHYGGRDNACEMITVERIPTAAAEPTWDRKKTENPM